MSQLLEHAVERHYDIAPALLWRAWTEHLAEWWAPRPWTTEVIALDLRPGGAHHVVMHGPGGENSPYEGVFLEIVPEQRIVMTNAYRADWIPQPAFLTALFEFTPDGKGGTRYRAAARHWDQQSFELHRTMGFDPGWGVVADQLAEVARQLA